MTELEEQLAHLAHKYGLTAIYVFGSRAPEIAARVHGEGAIVQRPQSDVDIAVQPARSSRLSAQARVQLAMALEDLFDAPRVDLVVLPEANPFLAIEAIRGELLFCADPDAQAEDELYFLRRGGDLLTYQRERWQQLIEREG